MNQSLGPQKYCVPAFLSASGGIILVLVGKGKRERKLSERVTHFSSIKNERCLIQEDLRRLNVPRNVTVCSKMYREMYREVQTGVTGYFV